MILLDTNAIIWLEIGHARARSLAKSKTRLFISPASVLELHYLFDLARLKLKRGRKVQEVVDDERWRVDEPPARAWFEEAAELRWTRDPFDRLIAAHARVRGYKLATGDGAMLAELDRRTTMEL